MKDCETWTHFDHASGRSFVNSRNFITAAIKMVYFWNGKFGRQAKILPPPPRPFSPAQLKYFHPGQPRSRSPRPKVATSVEPRIVSWHPSHGGIVHDAPFEFIFHAWLNAQIWRPSSLTLCEWGTKLSGSSIFMSSMEFLLTRLPAEVSLASA